MVEIGSIPNLGQTDDAYLTNGNKISQTWMPKCQVPNAQTRHHSIQVGSGDPGTCSKKRAKLLV